MIKVADAAEEILALPNKDKIMEKIKNFLKIDDFLKKQGKTLKPAKERKDSKKLTAKERNELIDQMLKDFGYIK